ncbi:MAG: Gfo/Idh/MocA family oxidoreductase [Clostridia bacterium]|nr:Gfo/Idh/MocA family oxidoreductase [Clostridia bacterium]
MDKIRIGIIGLGNMGSGHADNIYRKKLCPEIELKAIADIKPEKEAWIKENLGDDIAFFDDAEKMMDSGLIDAVIVSVPHYDHPKYVIMALNKGLHAMCEKPAGVYTKQVREMNEVASKSDKVFGLMFNQRTDHVYRKMREIVKSGEMGEIKRTNWLITNWYRSQRYYNSGGWRATWSGEGGGVLLNQCPHNIDLWQWICGMPCKVDAKLHYGKWHDIEVEDDVTAYVEYPNGATGVFITTTGDLPGTNRFEISLEKGKLVAEDGHLYKYLLPVNEREYCFTPDAKVYGGPDAVFSEVETDGQSPQHVGVLNAFAGNILHGTPLVARGEEGINGLTISNAMHLSSFLGKPVDIPFSEDLYYEELMKRVKTSKKKTTVDEFVADTSSSYNTGKK